ncbi:MAG: hypothetical protein Q8L10_03410 [Candidatus Moranbacteria bacterium]|nr:hypothetical protein [Candidatus Moranbacteria bacterium]
MSKTKLLLISTLAIFGTAFFVPAQAQEAPLAPPELQGPTVALPVQVEGTVDCFDYYKFGSVQVDVEAETAATVSGVPMTFSATLKNDNDYPIVDGAVYAKVFRSQKDQDQAHANGNFLVDQFFVQEDISLGAKEQKKINFTWQVPNYAVSGDYQIAMFFTSAKKFNLLGLSFTDDVVGNTLNFSVVGELDRNVEFDKNAVKTNDQDYHFAAFPPRFKDEDITVKTSLVNATPEAQSIPVVWKLYSWDGQTEENLIETKNETIQIDSNATKQLTYVIKDKAFPVYYLVAEARYQDTKSILDIRTVRENVNKVRINFPSITNYPLKQNEKNTLFVCAHNSGTADVIDNNKLVVTLLDENQKEIHKYAYQGQISGAMMGLKEEFTPKQNYATFYIKSELFTDGQLVDSAQMKYDCRQLDPEACPSQAKSQIAADDAGDTQENPWLKPLLLIILVSTFALSLIVFIIKRKRPYVGLFLLGFIAVSMLLGGAGRAEAKSVVWNDILKFTGKRTYVGMYTSDVAVTLNATLQNAGTGVVLSDGSFIAVGTKINIITNHSNTDISWFGTGYNLDSPYGYWKNLASRPVGASCVNLVNWIGDGNEYYYTDLSVNPPSIVLSNSGTASLSCSGLVCTVNSPGTIRLNINFSSTYGKWHWSWIPGYYYPSSQQICTTEYTELSAPDVTIPSQAISYDLTAVSSNNPPAIPVITGPTTGIVNTNYNFTATATDPDGDQLKYGIDWDNNNIIDQWLPGTGVVNSGISQTATRQWPTVGAKTFKVNACDSKGGCSAWSSPFRITISTPPDPCASIDPIAGRCGVADGQAYLTAPASNLLCASGNPSPASLSGSGPWNWNCNGICSTSNASCSASQSVDLNWKEVNPN